VKIAPVLLAASLVLAASSSGATIAERVVAVVGDRPILWSELQRRAVGARMQIRAQTSNPDVVTVQEQEMYRELLDRMIADRLEQQQADHAHIRVTAGEIDRGIADIAAQAQAMQGRPMTVAQVMTVARGQGMTEEDFRDEIRRQILEGKLLEVRVRPRVRVTEPDVRAAYERTRAESRNPSSFPSFETVRGAMTERAWVDATARARAQWLTELRANAYVDVRL
jgi:peptidyl-prolyl cis-trans isomerase SurA